MHVYVHVCGCVGVWVGGWVFFAFIGVYIHTHMHRERETERERHARTRIHLPPHTHKHTRTHTHTHKHTHTRTHKHMYRYIFKHIHTCIHMYVYQKYEWPTAHVLRTAYMRAQLHMYCVLRARASCYSTNNAQIYIHVSPFAEHILFYTALLRRDPCS